MKLDALLIADAVSAPPDGKFNLLGGGLTRITVPSTPFVLGQLGVLVRLLIDDEEVGTSHQFGFAMRDPDGTPIGRVEPFTAELPAENLPLVDGERRAVNIAANIGPMLFQNAGLNHFDFLVDGAVFASAPLPVVVLPPAQEG